MTEPVTLKTIREEKGTKLSQADGNSPRKPSPRIVEGFGSRVDYRVHRTKKPLLIDILVIPHCALIRGAN
jgi:hypothetical protein